MRASHTDARVTHAAHCGKLCIGILAETLHEAAS
jgi:hypothetical protein